MSAAFSAPDCETEIRSASASLRFRYRCFLAVILLLAACVALSLALHETAWSHPALVGAGILVGLGVPWLGWHLRVPFAARVAAPILQLAGLSLDGQDPRDNLWSLADLPVLFFLIGWIIDICLRQQEKWRSVVGRVLFNLLWLYLAGRTLQVAIGEFHGWFESILIALGAALVWLPRGTLLPAAYRIPFASGSIVDRGLRSAGGWIATRVGIAILIVLPTVIYLDLLELPPLLKTEMRHAATASADGEDEGPSIYFWRREARALLAEDLDELEVHSASPEATETVIEAIRQLRRDPDNPEFVDTLRGLSDGRIAEMEELRDSRGTVPVFYIETGAAGDNRVTSGLFSVPDSRWIKWDELELLTGADVDRHRRNVHRATIVVLINGVLILLLLGGPSGGSPAAWWLAIYLAGTNLGWAGESLDFLVDRVRYVMWREYSDDRLGATLFGLHSLLLFFSSAADWLIRHQVLQAGIWVALCWPTRPNRLLRSALDRFWVQCAKTVALAFLLYTAYLAFLLATGGKKEWMIAWFVVYPVLLIGAGWWRRRTLDPVVRPPAFGRLAAAAFLLRGWVVVLTTIDLGWDFAAESGWFGHAAVVLGAVAIVMLILALERGTFLSPPHVEGQLWLIGVAALPFIESVVGDPVSGFIEDSGLFLGTAVGWLAFGAAVWLIGPVFSFLGDWLSRWRARGLGRIESVHEDLKSFIDSSRVGGEIPFDRCLDLLQELQVHDAALWKHEGAGWFRRVEKSRVSPDRDRLTSSCFAASLAEAEGSLRLEEMRMEWSWAAYHRELDLLFETRGDLLLIPASYEGRLVALLWASDVPQNRFLLRPAVAVALGKLLATATLATGHQAGAVAVSSSDASS